MKINTFELNIGLNNNPHSETDVKAILKALAFEVDKIRTDQGEYDNKPEPTVIYKGMTIDPMTTITRKVKDLCIIFKQECIALSFNNNGRLIYHPRYKRKRIKFNHKYFIKF